MVCLENNGSSNDSIDTAPDASWSRRVKSLLLSVDDQSCLIVRERLCEEIFSIIAGNIHDVLQFPVFFSAVVSKLEEWRFYPVDSGESRIFQKYSFLVDLSHPLCEIKPK